MNQFLTKSRSWLARAASIAVIATASTTHAACPFVNSGWDAVNDGVILTRYALNIFNTPLVANTRLSSSDPAAVKTSLDGVRLALDMNGDGAVTTLDSLIIARYLAGYRGASLAGDLSLGAGSRNSNDAIVLFIAQGCPAPVASRTPIYEALSYVTDRTALLAQANAQGARGFQLIGPQFVGPDSINLYVKDQNTTFTYEVLDTATTQTALATQLNAQGARGFRLDNFFTSGNYYIKDNSAALTYQYELLAEVNTSSGFLAQANGQGARGFYFVFTYSVGGTTVAMYGKDSSNAVYQYELHPRTNENVTADNFVVQADTQGARGFKYVTGFFFFGNPAGDTSRNIYMKDTAQSATFSYKAQLQTSNAATLVTQANAEGQLNFVYAGAQIFFPDGFAGAQQPRNMYFKPLNCAGVVLCSAGGVF
jgi:hypothetical protein